MLSDRLADPPTLLMACVLAAYAVIVVRLAMREAACARRRRAVADWRALPQVRIDRIAAGTAPRFDSTAPAHRAGWSTLQRHRIDRRRRYGVRAATW